MKPETYEGPYYEVDTSMGTWFVPEDVSGNLKDCVKDRMYGPPDRDTAATTWKKWLTQLADYHDGGAVAHITKRSGTLYRLSAPGYLDCTEWSTSKEDIEEDIENDDS